MTGRILGALLALLLGLTSPAQAQERTSSAQVLGAQAAVRIEEINLGYTEIVSPIDGKIGRATLTATYEIKG